MITLLSAVTGWLLFAALVIALGGVVARWLLVPRAVRVDPSALGPLRPAADRLAFLGAILLPVAMALAFGRQLVEFHDPFVSWAEDARLLLTGTAWGATWSFAAGASMLGLVAGVLVRNGFGAGWGGVTIATLALAVYPPLSGHASGADELRSLTITADFLHVLAAGFWIGGLAFVLEAERAVRAGMDSVDVGRRSMLPLLVPIFSPLAIACVVTLGVTGALAWWVHLGSVGALFTTPYGRLLTLKLAVVTVVLYLGAVNWRRLTPRLDAEVGQASLRRNAAVELVVAQVVLLVTALLVRTPPMDP